VRLCAGRRGTTFLGGWGGGVEEGTSGGGRPVGRSSLSRRLLASEPVVTALKKYVVNKAGEIVGFMFFPVLM
jgi:hypothetical protein